VVGRRVSECQKRIRAYQMSEYGVLTLDYKIFLGIHLTCLVLHTLPMGNFTVGLAIILFTI
jgi:hypothetical protein